jgi:transaldolase
MNPLLELSDFGQSYWLDNLTRGKIESGELARRVQDEGLRGVTSNPSIFNQAISTGDEYDAQLRDLAESGLPIEQVYERIVVKDIRDACDVLRPVYDMTDGADGFVSLEVSPHLVYDAEGTMAEARRLYAAVARPNVLIKIPGSAEGVPAVRQMLYEGVNVNITLLFSIGAYEAVANAYIDALERRQSEGKSVDDIASVASFFLSRIDTLVDSTLDRLSESDPADAENIRALRGEAAVANAKLAYQSFKKIFSGARWERLAARGARVQRVLWASTSTKDPAYSDLKYVEPLIGPETVNTMPDRTIDAFRDHGRIVPDSVERDVAQAEAVMEKLAAVGVDFDAVTAQLLAEGVKKFIDPFDALLATLAERRETLLAARTPTTG